MINIEDLTIKQARELAGLFHGEKYAGQKTGPKVLGLQITVLDRGFVYVGNTVVEGEFVRIYNARNIRKWGTTKGLGEIAESGPTPNTIMDKCPDVLVPLKAVIHFISCTCSF
jgi:hypothetical protein